MKWQVPCILLMLCLLLPSATAAGITFTADQQDYYFLTGQPVEIPLAVENTYPGEMPGTLRFSTDTQLQKTGTVMISTANRVFSPTLPVGTSYLNLSMNPSPVSRDYKVHVSFYYAAPVTTNTSLPEFFVHIVADPGLIKSSPASLESMSVPETGEIPGESSTSIAEQSVSTRDQMGSDSSGGQSISAGQPQPDAEAAQQQQQREKEKREREQAAFDDRLAHDPLVIAVNTSLASEGFVRQTLDTQPAGNDTGTFSMLYQRGAEDRVIVQGSLTSGIVPSVQELANTAISPDPGLAANTTFQSFARTLAEGAYTHKETFLNVSLTGATANSSYTTKDGDRAYVNATLEDHHVIQVTLETGTGSDGFPLIPILFLVAGLVVIVGVFAYRRYQHRACMDPGVIPADLTPAFDYRKEAEQLLDEAELAFARKQYADAYGLAGRSLRLFLSFEYGNHEEVTVTDLVGYLQRAGRDTSVISALFLPCSDVAFACGEPDTGEFHSLITRIRGIIRQ